MTLLQVLTLAAVFVSALPRSAPEPLAFRACHVRYGVVDVDKLPGIRSGLERFNPPGTREYLGTPRVTYLLSGQGRSDLVVAAQATFSCEVRGLRVHDVGSRESIFYPVGSRVEREVGSVQYFVKPGEKIPEKLRADIRRGAVRFYKTL